MKVTINKTYPNYAEQKIYIQWDVESPPTSHIIFSVYRSEAPNAGFVQIASNIQDNCFYVDDLSGTPGIFSLERPIYYKVKAISGNETAESPAVYYDGTISENPKDQPDIDSSYRHMNRFQYNKQLRLLRNKLISDFKIALEKVYGIEAVLLKRKHWGERCGFCFDPVANKQIKSHCSQCYDTTWVGGYIPVNIYTQERGSMPLQVGSDITGPIETKQTSFSMLYFPKISYGDVLVIKYDNTRYVIRSVKETSIRTIPVHQTVVAEIIPPEHILYSFPLDTVEGVYYV